MVANRTIFGKTPLGDATQSSVNRYEMGKSKIVTAVKSFIVVCWFFRCVYGLHLQPHRQAAG